MVYALYGFSEEEVGVVEGREGGVICKVDDDAYIFVPIRSPRFP